MESYAVFQLGPEWTTIVNNERKHTRMDFQSKKITKERAGEKNSSALRFFSLLCMSIGFFSSPIALHRYANKR